MQMSPRAWKMRIFQARGGARIRTPLSWGRKAWGRRAAPPGSIFQELFYSGYRFADQRSLPGPRKGVLVVDAGLLQRVPLSTLRDLRVPHHEPGAFTFHYFGWPEKASGLPDHWLFGATGVCGQGREKGRRRQEGCSVPRQPASPRQKPGGAPPTGFIAKKGVGGGARQPSSSFLAAFEKAARKAAKLHLNG